MYLMRWDNADLALDNELTILIYTPWQELQEIRSLKNSRQKKVRKEWLPVHLFKGNYFNSYRP